MKILQVVHEFPLKQKAGTGIYTYNLSKELAKRHEVYVFYPINEPKKKPYVLEKKEYDGLNLIEINNPSSYLQTINPKVTYKNKKIDGKFEVLLGEIKPDIVHFHHLLNLSFNLPILTKRLKVPSVLTLADYWFICGYDDAHLLNSKFEICKSPSPRECRNCYIDSLLDPIKKKTNFPLLKNNFSNTLAKAFYGVRPFEKRFMLAKKIIEEVDIVISPSEMIKSLIEEYLQISDKSIEILYHGVEVEKLKKINKIPSNNLRFGYIGGIGQRKGLHILISAFNALKQGNIELQIYGGSISDEQFVKKFGSNRNPNIKIMGKFSHISEPFSNIDVLIVPSITYEGYGLVVQEAFASNTPVIASDIGALNEFVKHKENGLLFTVGDSNDLAIKMQMLVENPELLQQLKKSMPQVKSIEQYAKEYEKIYVEVIKHE